MAFFCSPSPMGVWKTPGAIAMTLILYLPRSLARGRTIPLTAPLVAAYMTWPRCPSYPATLLTTMITPRSPSTSGCSDIILAASLATLKVPTTLILRTRSISSVEATPLEQMMVPAVTTPAQCTTPLTFPKVFLVNQKSSLTLSSLTTSTLKKGVFNSLATSLPRSSLISAITTFAPRLSKSFTVARPKPEEPPVTTATKLASIFIKSNKQQALLHHRANHREFISNIPFLQAKLSEIHSIGQFTKTHPSWQGQSRLPARLQPKRSLGSSLSPRRQPGRPLHYHLE